MGQYAGSTAGIAFNITNITENTITFAIAGQGSSWSNHKAYLYQIIGRNM